MSRLPPLSTRLDTLFPYTPPFRSPMCAIAVHRQGIAPMERSCSLGSARDTAPYGSPAHCRASLHGDPGMLESVQPDPTSFCPIDSPDRKSTRLNSSH